MTNLYVVGVDGGASKTAAVILNPAGEVLGRGTSGSSNYHHVGLEGTRAALTAAMQEAASQAQIDLSQIAAATWALAGVDRPADRQLLQELARQILPGIPVQVENDAVAALVGGTGMRFGIVLIAGTGTIAYGEDGQGQHARAAGWGHLLDHGSAYDLAQEALRAIARAADDIHPDTRLTHRMLHHLQLQTPTDLVGWAYAPERTVTEIAALAPLVIAEAAAGDWAAADVVARGADAVADSVATVARRLSLWERSFPLVLAGGLLTASEFYRQMVTQAVLTRAPHAQPTLPRAEPAIGAALIALEALGYPPPASALGNSAPATSDPLWMSEMVNVLTRNLDLLPTLDIIGLMHVEDGRAVAAIRPILPAIATAVDAIEERMRRGGRLIYVGTGTSGRLGVLDASECPPTFGTDPHQVMGLIAGGPAALTSSIEAAEDDATAGQQAIAAIQAGPLDTVVGIAASGRTPYTLGAVQEARRRGAFTIALVCNLPAPLAEAAEHVIAPLVGPEVITGSTRLKAGTAQKLVLNMLSTATMVRLGKTYGNLMVDVQPTNAKLRARARRIVASVCGISEEEAQAALDRCDGAVKVAILTVLLQCTPAEARARLEQAGGVIRHALGDESTS